MCPDVFRLVGVSRKSKKQNVEVKHEFKKKKNYSRKGQVGVRGRETELAKLPLVFQHCGYWDKLETDATKDVLHSAPGTTISQSLPGIGSKTPGMPASTDAPSCIQWLSICLEPSHILVIWYILNHL